MHRFSNYSSNDGLVSYSPRTSLSLQHVHYIGTSASIHDLHDDPKEVRVDKGDMLAYNVPVTRRIHDGTFTSQLLH